MHILSLQVERLMRETAEAAILPYYQKLAAHQIEEKTPTPSGLTDLVTIADHEAEALLSAGLGKLLPSAAIVGEEACAADPALLNLLGDAQCWIIDPVDGTNNFGAGHPPFGIIIALAEAGETVAGWLYDPLTGRMCHAHKGRGAWIDGQPIKARESGDQLPVAAISLIFMDAEKRERTRAQLEGRFAIVDIPRCAAEQYPRLVLGQNDISLFERVLPWDHAAGVLFTNEAGGKVARIDGSAYSPAVQQKGLIGASSPRTWDLAAAALVD